MEPLISDNDEPQLSVGGPGGTAVSEADPQFARPASDLEQPSAPAGGPQPEPAPRDEDTESLLFENPAMPGRAFGGRGGSYSIGECMVDVFIRLPWFIFATIVYLVTFPIVGLLDMPIFKDRPQLQQNLIDVVTRTLQMWIALVLCNVYSAFQLVYESDSTELDHEKTQKKMLSAFTLVWEMILAITGIAAVIYIASGVMVHVRVPMLDFWFGLTVYLMAFLFRIFVEDWYYVNPLHPVLYLCLVMGFCLAMVVVSIALTRICNWSQTWFRRKKFELECDVFGLSMGHSLVQLLLLLLTQRFVPMRLHMGQTSAAEESYRASVRSSYYLMVASGGFLTLMILHGVDRFVPAIEFKFVPRRADNFRSGLSKYTDIVLGYTLGSMFIPSHRSFNEVEMFAIANFTTGVVVVVFIALGVYEANLERRSYSKYDHLKTIYSRAAAFMVAVSWDQAIQTTIEASFNSKILLLVYKSVYAFLATFAWVVIGLSITKLKAKVNRKVVRSQRLALLLDDEAQFYENPSTVPDRL